MKAKRPHKNATKYFDYTTILDGFRAVNWSNDYNLNGMFKPVNGIKTVPLLTIGV